MGWGTDERPANERPTTEPPAIAADREAAVPMSDDRLLRLRMEIAERLALVVIALVIVAALGGWLTYATHLEPDVEREERVVSSWTTTAAFEHEAVVREDTEAFSEGDVLTDREIYFTRIAPELDGEFAFGHSGDGELDASVELELVIRAVEERDEGTMTHWQVRESLGAEEATIGADDELAVPFSVDVNATRERIDRIEDELGSSPGDTEAVVLARVSADGTVNGEPVDIEQTHALAIEPDEPTYAVDAPETVEEEHRSTEFATAPVAYGPVRSVGSFALLLASLLGLLAIGVAHVRGTLEPPAKYRVAAERERERAEFDDWISRGSLAPELLDRPRVTIDSLEGLVDVAIDCDRRVLEECEREAYFVPDGELLYVYDPAGDDLDGGPAAMSGRSEDPDERDVALVEDGVDPADDGAEDGDGKGIDRAELAGIHVAGPEGPDADGADGSDGRLDVDDSADSGGGDPAQPEDDDPAQPDG